MRYERSRTAAHEDSCPPGKPSGILPSSPFRQKRLFTSVLTLSTGPSWGSTRWSSHLVKRRTRLTLDRCWEASNCSCCVTGSRRPQQVSLAAICKSRGALCLGSNGRDQELDLHPSHGALS